MGGNHRVIRNKTLALKRNYYINYIMYIDIVITGFTYTYFEYPIIAILLIKVKLSKLRV